MKVVHKHMLDLRDAVNEVPMSHLDKVLMAGWQPDRMLEHQAAIWIETEVPAQEALGSTRRFRVIGTGHDVPPGGKWRASAIAGEFVWHVYELPE